MTSHLCRAAPAEVDQSRSSNDVHRVDSAGVAFSGGVFENIDRSDYRLSSSNELSPNAMAREKRNYVRDKHREKKVPGHLESLQYSVNNDRDFDLFREKTVAIEKIEIRSRKSWMGKNLKADTIKFNPITIIQFVWQFLSLYLILRLYR